MRIHPASRLLIPNEACREAPPSEALTENAKFQGRGSASRTIYGGYPPKPYGKNDTPTRKRDRTPRRRPWTAAAAIPGSAGVSPAGHAGETPALPGWCEMGDIWWIRGKANGTAWTC